MKMVRLYRVDLPYACFGIDVDDNAQVVDAAPIGRWMIGKSLEFITRWVRGKHGTIENLGEIKEDVCCSSRPTPRS